MPKKNAKTKRPVVRRTSPTICSADDSRFRWLAKHHTVTLSFHLFGPDDGLWIEYFDGSGFHRVIHKGGLTAEQRMRGAIDQAMQNPTGLRCAGLDAHKQDPVVQIPNHKEE